MGLIHPSECSGFELEALEQSVSEDFAGVDAAKVLSECVVGGAQLWRVLVENVARGILVTQVREWPSGRELYVWHMGGEGIVKVMGQVQEKLEEYARACDCAWVRSLSRPGAGKLMRGLGYEVHAWMMLKQLGEEKNGLAGR